MKTEESTPTPQTPAPQYTTTQWNTQQIPIDPALQQHPQHPTTSYYQSYQHYPQASYGHYQPYLPPQTSQTQTPTPTPTAQRPVTQHLAPVTAAPPPPQPQPQQQQNQLDTADVATLNDALGSAGVDLRAEEETLQRTADQQQTYRPYEDRSRKQAATPAFDTRHVGAAMRAIGTKHKVPKIPEDSVSYVALALRARLQDMLTAMIAASRHRTDAHWNQPPSAYEDGTPMWQVVVRRDVAKQLAALEKAEREEEMRVRRERKELAAAQAAALAAHAPTAGGSEGDEEGGPKKKKKKADGPGVTAKNMSEDVRKKMSNAVASQAAGLGTGKYAWMNAASASAPAKPKREAVTSPATTTAPAAGASGSGGQSSWARPYLSTQKSQRSPSEDEESKQLVTLRDAMFVVERERGHGGGRGAARGWV